LAKIMKTHVIHWRCRISGKTGIGSILLEAVKADLLAKELNEEFPEIEHEAKVPENTSLRSRAAAEPALG
jgi:hypothetical protein